MNVMKEDLRKIKYAVERILDFNEEYSYFKEYLLMTD